MTATHEPRDPSLVEAEPELADVTALDEILATIGYVSERRLQEVVGRRVHPEPVVLSEVVDPTLLSCLPSHVARQAQALPIELTDRALVVAMADPADLWLLDHVEAAAGMPVEARTAAPQALEELLERLYPLLPDGEDEVATAVMETSSIRR